MIDGLRRIECLAIFLLAISDAALASTGDELIALTMVSQGDAHVAEFVERAKGVLGGERDFDVEEYARTASDLALLARMNAIQPDVAQEQKYSVLEGLPQSNSRTSNLAVTASDQAMWFLT